MCHRAELFKNKGLRDAIDRIWHSVTTADRNTMIAMYLGTRNPRTSIAHPSLTVDEARHIIESDSGLSIEQKDVACGIINTAIDKYGVPLFNF